jgi:hypothetical protein
LNLPFIHQPDIELSLRVGIWQGKLVKAFLSAGCFAESTLWLTGITAAQRQRRAKRVKMMVHFRDSVWYGMKKSLNE